ncbi:MAG TPA: peptidyl-prolyl cis-trans isomerase [Pyrinomonadaceae bacterium]|nr:peptidyl-prolyl cis-trans isomerase [Pyrinomonadaceae bacterium]
MKSKFIIAPLMLFAVLVASPSRSQAQEGEPVIVDEVIAQVNDGVVTLSQLKREMRERVDQLVQNGRTEADATSEVTKHKMELIATLINEMLLIQKGKELELTDRVEAEVNKRMLEVAKENGITSIDKLDEAMRQAKLDPAGIRATMRIEIMKQAVFENEVDSKLFYSYSQDELKKYFDSHQSSFLKPESIEISEIFLGLAGKQEPDVKAQAQKLVAQARGGADFCTLAAAYTDRPAAAGQKPCKVGRFQVPDLRPDIAAAVKSVNPGGVSEPLKTDEGYQILKVDSRTAGSNTPTFNENNVREMITRERSQKAREDYLQDLRNDAYVKIADSYHDAVAPLLKIVPPAAATKRPSKKDKKEKGSKP